MRHALDVVGVTIGAIAIALALLLPVLAGGPCDGLRGAFAQECHHSQEHESRSRF